MTDTRSLSQMKTEATGDRGSGGAAGDLPQSMVPARVWGWIAVLVVLFGGLHATYLERLFRVVTNAQGDGFMELLGSALGGGSWNPDWSHALVIPLISLYFIYLWRDRLLAAPVRISGWGLPVFCFGLLGYTWWIFPGRNDMLQGLCLIVSLFGLLLFLLGPAVMRVLWFPVFYLVFSVKVSSQLWEQIAWKMQNTAASVSHLALQFLGLVFNFEAEKSGNTLTLVFSRNGQMVSETMNVAEACSGLRMLMAFIALGTALAFIAPRPMWQRVLMMGLAVPVAIVVNVGRVTTLGLLNLVNPEYARGDFHTFVGLLMLIPAGLLILFIAWCADRIFIHDPAAAVPVQAASSNGAAARTDESRRLNPGMLGAAVAAGGAVTLLLGAAYAGTWALSGSALMRPLPQSVLMTLMMAMLVAAATGAGLLGRSVVALLSSRSRSTTVAAGVVAGMLLAAWVGQAAAVEFTKVVLIKKPVPTRFHLNRVPTQVGPWKMIADQSDQMTQEVIEVLGTTNFISRLYVLEAAAEPGLTAENLSRSTVEPGELARLHVAYYTGNPDTVPHVPDRCYLAGGAGYVDKQVVQLDLDATHLARQSDGGYRAIVASGLAMEVTLPDVEIPATRFTYLPQGSGSEESVVFFFLANGRYFATPSQVRWFGFDARDQYSYYCKVEVSFPGVSDREQTRRLAGAFVDQCLPEIMACLPDWSSVQKGLWPQPDHFGSASSRNGDRR